MAGQLKETPAIKKARQRAIDAQRKKQQAKVGLYSTKESKKRMNLILLPKAIGTK